MTTRGLGTACRPADATLVIAPGAACLLFGLLVIDIAGQPPPLVLLPSRPPPESPPLSPSPSREVAEELALAEAPALEVAEALAVAPDFVADADALALALADADAVAEPVALADVSAAWTVPADSVADAAGVALRGRAVLVAVADGLAFGEAEFSAFSALATDLDVVPGMRVSGANGVPPAKATPSTAA